MVDLASAFYNIKALISMRTDIYLMFSNYSQSFKLKWGRIINAGFNKIYLELEGQSRKYHCVQKATTDSVIWYDKNNVIQAMFCFPSDAKDFDSIFKIFGTIKKNKAPITFIFIHQVSDGKGNYDIFGISEKSYLEHVNRVRFRKK